MEDQPIQSFKEFWPVYLREHSKLGTQLMHVAATSLGVVIFAYGLLTFRPGFMVLAVATGYGLAFLSHFLIQKNRPLTFRHPVWSFISDFYMSWLFLTGKLKNEMTRLGIRR